MSRDGGLHGTVSDQLALTARPVLSWRALVAAAVLSLALGVVLYEGLAGEHSLPGPRPSTPPRIFAPAAHRTERDSRAFRIAAQGPVSEALGAEDPAYRVSASGGGFAAASPAQHLRASFGRSGVSVSSGSAQVGLSLRAVGYGASLSSLGAVAPR